MGCIKAKTKQIRNILFQVLWTELCLIPNLYVEILIPNVMAYGDEFFGRQLGLNEVVRVGREY